MQLVSGDDVSDCTGTDFLLVRDAAPLPFLVREMLEKVHRRAAHRR